MQSSLQDKNAEGLTTQSQTLKEKQAYTGLNVNVRWEALAEDDEDECLVEPTPFFSPTGKNSFSKKSQQVTTGVKHKLNFRMFRSRKQIEDINELYDIGKKLGEGAFGAVFEA